MRWSELLLDSGRCVAKYIVEEGPNPAGGSPACCNHAGWQDGFRAVNDPDPTGFGGGTVFNGYIHAGELLMRIELLKLGGVAKVHACVCVARVCVRRKL